VDNLPVAHPLLAAWSPLFDFIPEKQGILVQVRS
jgi:hypothetical protein